MRRRQRKLARVKRGRKNRLKVKRQVQRWHEHVSNQRRDFAHKLSYVLVQDYDLIALENLRISNMAQNHHPSKSILDAGWGIFKHLLTYKAENACREVAFVNPADTSKTCSNRGAVFEHLTLADLWVECCCGLSVDRNVNAAINVLKRALSGRDAPMSPNVEETSLMRAPEATRIYSW